MRFPRAGTGSCGPRVGSSNIQRRVEVNWYFWLNAHASLDYGRDVSSITHHPRVQLC